MNKLILCEGETDAILLSYYLGKTAGWKYTSKTPDGANIQKRKDNESVNWYKKDKDYLLICGVGGKDNFGNFFDAIIKNPLVTSNVFVQQMRAEADKYISTERLQLKAHLGVTWAVQFPEKVFRMIDEQINSVRWKEYDTLKECFGILNEI